MLRRIAAACLAASLVAAQPALACTGIQLTAKDQGVVAARTLEFGIDPKSEVLVIPAGTRFTSKLADGGDGVSFETKYGMAGANLFGLTAIGDGLNEQGLYVGLFYFPGYASYAEPDPSAASQSIAAQDYAVWLLGNFSSVEEVKANYDKLRMVGVPVEAIGGPPPVHFVVHDRSGQSVVIEPLDGTLKIFDNPVGVLTNSPAFDWHMTNLRNYTNLSVTNVPPLSLEGLKLSSFGQGSGLHGLPGDFTPPSRFVRAVAFTQSAIPADTAPEAVLAAFHILNNFDIPVGSVRDDAHGQVIAEYTAWTAASDLKNLVWYFRTYEDQTIRAVDLKAALAAAGKEIRVIPMTSKQPIVDVSTHFQ